MRLLVTGGAGYVGSHLVHYAIRRGHTCMVYDNLSRGHESFIPKGVELVRADVRDDKVLASAIKHFKPDVILHYAALALVPESVENPTLYFENNVNGVLSFFRVYASIGFAVPIIFSSTCAVFGIPSTLPIAENDPKFPTSPYGVSKLMAEQILASCSEQFKIKSLALRYFNACGASTNSEIGELHEPETHLIPNILRAAAQNQKIRLFGNDYPTKDGTCIRDYIHVDDLAKAHLLGCEYLFKHSNDVGLEAIHLGTGNGYSNLEVLAAVEKILGKKIDVSFEPRRPGDPPALYANPQKAKEVLNFNATHSSLENIIETAWRFSKKHVFISERTSIP